MEKWEGVVKGIENDLLKAQQHLESADISISKVEAIEDGKDVWAFHLLKTVESEYGEKTYLKLDAKGYAFGDFSDPDRIIYTKEKPYVEERSTK